MMKTKTPSQGKNYEENRDHSARQEEARVAMFLRIHGSTSGSAAAAAAERLANLLAERGRLEGARGTAEWVGNAGRWLKTARREISAMENEICQIRKKIDGYSARQGVQFFKEAYEENQLWLQKRKEMGDRFMQLALNAATRVPSMRIEGEKEVLDREIAQKAFVNEAGSEAAILFPLTNASMARLGRFDREVGAELGMEGYEKNGRKAKFREFAISGGTEEKMRLEIDEGANAVWRNYTEFSALRAILDGNNPGGEEAALAAISKVLSSPQWKDEMEELSLHFAMAKEAGEVFKRRYARYRPGVMTVRNIKQQYPEGKFPHFAPKFTLQANDEGLAEVEEFIWMELAAFAMLFNILAIEKDTYGKLAGAVKGAKEQKDRIAKAESLLKRKDSARLTAEEVAQKIAEYEKNYGNGGALASLRKKIRECEGEVSRLAVAEQERARKEKYAAADGEGAVSQIIRAEKEWAAAGKNPPKAIFTQNANWQIEDIFGEDEGKILEFCNSAQALSYLNLGEEVDAGGLSVRAYPIGSKGEVAAYGHFGKNAVVIAAFRNMDEFGKWHSEIAGKGLSLDYKFDGLGGAELEISLRGEEGE